jgi:hypothetical protein
MGAQKKVKKSNESINSRLALVMKSGKIEDLLKGNSRDSVSDPYTHGPALDCYPTSPFLDAMKIG